MKVDEKLLCELFLCRKYTWNRAAGENLTVVPHCPNQFQGLKFQLFFVFSSKFLELEMQYYYLRFYTAESRPGEECLMRFQEFSIFPTQVSRPMKLGKLTRNCLFGCFCCHF